MPLLILLHYLNITRLRYGANLDVRWKETLLTIVRRSTSLCMVDEFNTGSRPTIHEIIRIHLL